MVTSLNPSKDKSGHLESGTYVSPPYATDGFRVYSLFPRYRSFPQSFNLPTIRNYNFHPLFSP